MYNQYFNLPIPGFIGAQINLDLNQFGLGLCTYVSYLHTEVPSKLVSEIVWINPSNSSCMILAVFFSCVAVEERCKYGGYPKELRCLAQTYMAIFE
jgi:hypothetical protein